MNPRLFHDHPRPRVYGSSGFHDSGWCIRGYEPQRLSYKSPATQRMAQGRPHATAASLALLGAPGRGGRGTGGSAKGVSPQGPHLHNHSAQSSRL